MDAEAIETAESLPTCRPAGRPPRAPEPSEDIHGRDNPERRLTAECFARGDYAAAALKGGEQEWQTYAALGLIGKTGEALEGLARFDHPEAAFYTAVAHWIGGADEEAIRGLEPLDTVHARNLLALLRKPCIDVLTQWPWVRCGCANLLAGAAADPRFRIANISFHPDDLPNKPYANIHDYSSFRQPPDFYICTMVEWHLVPPNLQELPCPVFGQTADYDLHIQTVYPWLGLFDALLVTDPSEWHDVTHLVHASVYTFPKSFGVPSDVPPLPQEAREIDVYLSGTQLHPYHPDKAQLLHQLLEDPQLRVKVINGFLSPGDYYSDLARSKICITYVRHPTALPTRGLEALAMGCALIAQEDNVLTLFAGREQGVLTYQLERRDLASAVRHILDRWPEFARRAEAGSRIIRREFALERVASQYLRFLTFLAAQPRGPRKRCEPMKLHQKRSVLHKGWLPSGDLKHSPVLQSIALHNYRRLKSAASQRPSTPHVYLDLAREAVLVNCYRAEADLIPVSKWLAFLRNVYRSAQQRFPHSLVVRFNHIRVLLHFGAPKQVSQALQLLKETLDLSPNRWRIDVMEDVFPWDFFPQFFNYRGYFDRLTAHLMKGTPVEADLCRLILASLHAYRGFYPAHHGFYSQALDDYGTAAALDPDFPFYRLWYAEQLLHRGLPEDRNDAYHLLEELAASTSVFREALELLEKSGHKGEPITRNAARSREMLTMQENMAVPKLQLKPDWSELQANKRNKARQEWRAWEEERENLYKHIQSMENTKIWKLRLGWLWLKNRFWKK